MSDFDTLFPNFVSQAQQLRTVLMPIAFVLMVIGVVSSTITGQRSPSAYLRTVARTFAIGAVLVFLVSWGDQIAQITDDTVRNTLNADPSAVYAKYNAALQIQKSGSGESSWWDKIWNADAAIFEALISFALWLLGLLASLILFYAYLVQKFILYVGYALSPIFIGFLAVQSLRSVGINYLQGLAGVMLWPLGWGVAALLTNGLIDFMSNQSFLVVVGGPAGSDLYSLQNLIGVAALALWLIFSTIAGPVILQKAIAAGSQVGAALASGAATAAGAAVTAAVGTANSAALAGGGAIPSLALGGVAGATALGGSSLSGSQYSPMASLVGELGRSAQSSGGGSRTQPKADSSASDAPTPVRFDKQDPANDNQIQEMIDTSRKSAEGAS